LWLTCGHEYLFCRSARGGSDQVVNLGGDLQDVHALGQIAGRDAGIGVSQSALEDAFANPNAIQYAPSAYGPTFRFVGNNATVVINAQGNVVTGWATSSAGVGP
jgi:hypothetical protein